MPGAGKGWTRWLMGLRPQGRPAFGAGSIAHSQGRSLGKNLGKNDGLSASFSLEEGWTMVKRREQQGTTFPFECSEFGGFPDFCGSSRAPQYAVSPTNLQQAGADPIGAPPSPLSSHHEPGAGSLRD